MKNCLLSFTCSWTEFVRVCVCVCMCVCESFKCALSVLWVFCRFCLIMYFFLPIWRRKMITIITHTHFLTWNNNFYGDFLRSEALSLSDQAVKEFGCHLPFSSQLPLTHFFLPVFLELVIEGELSLRAWRNAEPLTALLYFQFQREIKGKTYL